MVGSHAHAAGAILAPGQRTVAAEPVGRKIDVGHILQHALSNEYRVQIRAIAAHRGFAKRAAVRIIEQEARQVAPGDIAKVADRSDCCHCDQAIVHPPSMAMAVPVI